MTDQTPRRIPGREVTCQRCRRTIVFARTVASPNGRGGKAMPIDVVEDLAGNVAVFPVARDVLTARVLFKDETVDRPIEYAGMPHFATCPGSPEGSNPRLPDDVADLAAHRNRKGAGV